MAPPSSGVAGSSNGGSHPLSSSPKVVEGSVQGVISISSAKDSVMGEFPPLLGGKEGQSRVSSIRSNTGSNSNSWDEMASKSRNGHSLRKEEPIAFSAPQIFNGKKAFSLSDFSEDTKQFENLVMGAFVGRRLPFFFVKNSLMRI